MNQPLCKDCCLHLAQSTLIIIIIIIIIIYKTKFIVLSSMAQSHMREFAQRQVDTNSQAELQTWPLSPPVGCYRPKHIAMYHYSTMKMILTYCPLEGARPSWARHCSKCGPCPKLHIAVVFVKKKYRNFCPQRGFDPEASCAAGKHATFRHCDLLASPFLECGISFRLGPAYHHQLDAAVILTKNENKTRKTW